MKPISHYSLLLLSFLYVALGIGLIGCDRDDGPEEKHVAPDAYDAYTIMNFSVQGDSLSEPEGFVGLNYMHEHMFAMCEGAFTGCSGIIGHSGSCDKYYYDQFNWTPLTQAEVRLNGILLQYNEEESILSEESFLEGSVRFDFPEGAQFGLQPGDSVRLEISVDGYESWYDSYEPQLRRLEYLTLPADSTVYMPGDSVYISITDQRSRVTATLYEDEGMERYISSRQVTDLVDSVGVPIRSYYQGDECFLVVSQEAGEGRNYFFKRTLLLNQGE